MQIKPIFPKKIDFYVEKLKEDKMDDYYNVIGAIKYFGQHMDGYQKLIFTEMSLPMVDAGLIYPNFFDEGERSGFLFLVWSYHKGKFMRADQMDPDEARFSKRMMEYFTSVN